MAVVDAVPVNQGVGSGGLGGDGSAHALPAGIEGNALHVARAFGLVFEGVLSDERAMVGEVRGGIESGGAGRPEGVGESDPGAV